MEQIRFYKEGDRWYADLPAYLEIEVNDDNGGYSSPDKEDLQMVLGADDLLEELSNYKEEVTLLITEKVDEVREKEQLPAFAKHNWEYLIRADYVPVYIGKYYTAYNSRYLWLCPVLEWVFGHYPQQIYYKIVKTKENENNKR